MHWRVNPRDYVLCSRSLSISLPDLANCNHCARPFPINRGPLQNNRNVHRHKSHQRTRSSDRLFARGAKFKYCFSHVWYCEASSTKGEIGTDICQRGTLITYVISPCVIHFSVLAQKGKVARRTACVRSLRWNHRTKTSLYHHSGILKGLYLILLVQHSLKRSLQKRFSARCSNPIRSPGSGFFENDRPTTQLLFPTKIKFG